jgi:hypothetical protein
MPGAKQICTVDPARKIVALLTKVKRRQAVSSRYTLDPVANTTRQSLHDADHTFTFQSATGIGMNRVLIDVLRRLNRNLRDSMHAGEAVMGG